MVRVDVASDTDIARIRQLAQRLAESLPFTTSELAAITSVVAELARNLRSYAVQGSLSLAIVERDGRQGLRVVSQDQGPGMQDPTLALVDGFSTSGRPGLGLASARRSVDEFHLRSQIGIGTEITLHKWAR